MQPLSFCPPKNTDLPHKLFAVARNQSKSSEYVSSTAVDIGSGAFSGCTGLTSVAIGNGVRSIGKFAFSGCTGLTSVAIGNGVRSIGNFAFSGCTGLTSVTIPDSVTSIGNSAFSGCTGLTSVTIGNAVADIDVEAFYGCKGLTSVTIPKNITNIGKRAFFACSNLAEVYLLNPHSLSEESSEFIFSYNASIYSHGGGSVEKFAGNYGYKFVSVHMWDNGKMTKEPQVGAAGEKTFTCTVCSETRTEEIASLTPPVSEKIEIKSSGSAKELSDGIVGATHSLTVSELLALSNASYVADKDGSRVADAAKPLATGMRIVFEADGKKLEKVISVFGDVNGDGVVSVTDARSTLRAAVGLDTLDGAYFDAARVSGGDKISVTDARLVLRAAVALDTGKDWLANIS